jgi:hypothetical protein
LVIIAARQEWGKTSKVLKMIANVQKGSSGIHIDDVDAPIATRRGHRY